MSVQTSAAYKGARGPNVNWNRNATAQIRTKRATALLSVEATAIPTRERAIPACPTMKMVRRPHLWTKYMEAIEPSKFEA